VSKHNEILANLGVPDPDDSMAIKAPDGELSQGAVADRLDQAVGGRSLNYETLPLVCESFIAALVGHLFERDDHFPYIHGDDANSGVAITTSFSRGTLKYRDRRPLIVVAFQQAGTEELSLGNTMAGRGPNQVPLDTKSVMDNSDFRISVLHHNRHITLFLAQQIRALLIGHARAFQGLFGVQKVYPASLRGPGLYEQYDDLYVCYIDLRLQSLPKWEETVQTEVVRKLLIKAILDAQSLTQEGLRISQEIHAPAAEG